jgi:hypothetical protein
MTAIEMSEKVQDGVLKAVTTTQGWTLGAMRSTASAFDTVKPDTSRMPFADKVPTPSEAVELTFGFWGKLLDAQHSFASEMADIYAPPAVVVTPAKKA